MQCFLAFLKVKNNQALRPYSKAAWSLGYFLVLFLVFFDYFAEELEILWLFTMIYVWYDMVSLHIISAQHHQTLPCCYSNNGWLTALLQTTPHTTSSKQQTCSVHTKGLIGPYFSRAFLKGVGVCGVLSTTYF